MLWLVSAALGIGAFWAHMKYGASKLFWAIAVFAASVFSIAVYVENSFPSFGNKGVGSFFVMLLRALK